MGHSPASSSVSASRCAFNVFESKISTARLVGFLQLRIQRAYTAARLKASEPRRGERCGARPKLQPRWKHLSPAMVRHKQKISSIKTIQTSSTNTRIKSIWSMRRVDCDSSPQIPSFCSLVRWDGPCRSSVFLLGCQRCCLPLVNRFVSPIGHAGRPARSAGAVNGGRRSSDGFVAIRSLPDPASTSGAGFERRVVDLWIPFAPAFVSFPPGSENLLKLRQRHKRKVAKVRKLRKHVSVGGGCWLVVGSWRLAVGGWWLAVGGWRLAVGSWWLAVGGWWLVAGGWRLVAVGGWRLAVGGWWLGAGGWRLVVGGWRLVVGGWLFVVGGWRLGWWLVAGGWRLVVGGWRLAVGGWVGGWWSVVGGGRLAVGGWWLVAGG